MVGMSITSPQKQKSVAALALLSYTFGTQLSSLDKQSRKYTLDENVSDFSIIPTYATCRPSANAHELTCEPITGTYVKDTRRAEEPIVRYGDGVALIEVLPVPVD